MSVRAPGRRTGTGPGVQWDNQLLEYAKSLEQKPGPNKRVSRGPNGTQIEPNAPTAPAASPVTLTAMQVDSESTAYVTCRKVTFNSNGTFTPSGTAINVAKPWTLRAEPWWSSASVGGINYPRALTNPAYIQNRVPWIIPSGSAVTQLIYCIENPVGGTGVFVSGIQLTWLDANNDQRHWAYPKDVCIGGTAMKQLFNASPPYSPPPGQAV